MLPLPEWVQSTLTCLPALRLCWPTRCVGRYELKGKGGGGHPVLLAEAPIQDEIEQVVFDFGNPATGWAAKESHQVVAVQGAVHLGYLSLRLQVGNALGQLVDLLLTR